MKKHLLIISVLAAAFCVSACWKSELPDAEQIQKNDLHQVSGLSALADDESVTLSWNIPEGFTPSDYSISYLDTESAKQELTTGGATTYTIAELKNGFEYSFDVKAVYGSDMSGVVTVKSIPHTRGLENAKVDDSGNGYVIISWTTPSYSDLSGYTATYFESDNAASKKTVQIAKDKTSYTFEGLTNEKEYTFSLVANYPSKTSAPVELKGTPTKITPFTVDKTDVVAGELVTFTYNQELLPATDVKWILPDGKVRTGDKVSTGVPAKYDVATNDAQLVTVELNATVNGYPKKWSINLNVKPYMFVKTDWEKGSSTYNGFKNAMPVFAPDGKTMYIITFQSPTGLYAIDPKTGVEKWRFLPATAMASYNGCTVNPVTGDIYFGGTTEKHFYCVKPDGTLKWENTELGAMNQSSTPAVSKDGKTVFTHDGAYNVCSINAETGAVNWKKAMPNKGGGLIVNGDELIVGSNTNTGGVKFLKVSNGEEIASIDLPDIMSDGGGFAVSPDRKTAYLGSKLGSVFAIDIVNHTLIASQMPPQDNTNCNIWELVVSKDGSVFGGSKRGYTFCLKAETLDILWVGEEIAKTANGYNYAHPCCDTDGNFYITSGGVKNQNFIYSPSGAVLEQWSELTTANQKQMAGNALYDGVFYSCYLGAANDSGAMVARNVGGAQLGTSGWPCHGGDICGSCCIK